MTTRRGSWLKSRHSRQCSTVTVFVAQRPNDSSRHTAKRDFTRSRADRNGEGGTSAPCTTECTLDCLKEEEHLKKLFGDSFEQKRIASDT